LHTSQSKIDVQEFVPRRGLHGSHMQTLGSHLLSRRNTLPPSEERLIEVEPGVKVLCHCNWQEDRQQKLTIIIIHGLEGSSSSGYAVGIAEKGLAQGMNVVRMNQRNCGGTGRFSPTLYHSGRSADLDAVTRHFIAQDDIRNFALVGYSMGGNLVLKIAGEWGAQAPAQFRAVAAVCPAMDLAPSADALHLLRNRLYEIYFLVKLRRRLREKALLFPGVFDVGRLRGIRSLRDFDDKITAYYCGFTGADDYYSRSSASNVVDRIAVPTLIVHAANDPFIRIMPETRRKVLANPNITFMETADGGHCSYIADPDGYDGYWAEKTVVEFLREF
jgi:predicted alpha/beta-fold hydrolase